jgi:hypothetical protein
MRERMLSVSSRAKINCDLPGKSYLLFGGMDHPILLKGSTRENTAATSSFDGLNREFWNVRSSLGKDGFQDPGSDGPLPQFQIGDNANQERPPGPGRSW